MEEQFFATKPKEGEAWDVVLIGSGPASLTAAIYTTRGAASTLILGGEQWGGQLMLTTVVDNYPGYLQGIHGPDLMLTMRKQSERFGASFVEKNVDSVDFSQKPFKLTAGGITYLAETVIVGTGAETVWLGVPGEKELIGRGVSSCAPCDAPFFKGKKVIVVGGGDSAMEESLVLSKYASEITIVHRRDSFKASAVMQKRVLAIPGVKVLWNTEVSGFVGDQKLEKVALKNNKTGTTEEMALDGAFIAIGHKPSTGIFQGKIDLDEKGFVKKYERDGYKMLTSIDGVFVAGDVHDMHYRQAITAAGFGCMAGMDTLNYLSSRS